MRRNAAAKKAVAQAKYVCVKRRKMEKKQAVLARSPEILNRKFVEYLAPTLLMNLSLAITNVVNAVMVGHLLGSDALAAVNLCMPALSLANAVFNTVIMGACTLIVAEKGRMNTASADRYFTQFAVLGMGIMLVIPLAILLFLQPMALLFMGGVENPAMRSLVTAYLFPIAFSFPFVFLALSGSMVLRTEGWPRFGALVVLAANVVNLIAAFLLIFLFKMGVAGAAWGTVIGFAAGALLTMRYFFEPARTLHFCRLGKNPFRGFTDVVMTGLPSGSTSLLMFARVLLLNALIFRLFEVGGAAAFAVCTSTQYFAVMFLLGVTGAMQPISAMLFGEKDVSGLKILARTALGTAVPIMTFFAVLFFAVPGFIGNLYGLTGPGRPYLPDALCALALSLPLCAVNYYYLTYCQTIRRITLGLILSFASGFGWIAVLSPLFYFVFSRYFWYLLPAAEFFTSLTLLSAMLFLHKREKVSWILVRNESSATLELSLRRSDDALSSLSERFNKFCALNGFNSEQTQAADRLVREIADSALRHSDVHSRRVLFDLMVKIEQGEMTGRFRISGADAAFSDDPNAPGEPEIDRLRQLASEVRVMTTLGLNRVFFRMEPKNDFDEGGKNER